MSGLDERLEAYEFGELLVARFLGWSIVMGGPDGRKRQHRIAGAWLREIISRMPKIEALDEAMRAGQDIADLWPEHMREIVRFQIGHKVPRAVNEPTSEQYCADMRTHGRDDYGLSGPLVDHGKPATAEDHPAYPEIENHGKHHEP